MTTSNYQRATEAEITDRINVMMRLRIDGYQQADAVNYCAEHYPDWNVTKRHMRNYYQDACDNLASLADQIDRREYFRTALARYEVLYRKAVEQNDLRTAAAVNDKIVQLLNLEQHDALKVDWRAEFSDDEARALLERMVDASKERALLEAASDGK